MGKDKNSKNKKGIAFKFSLKNGDKPFNYDSSAELIKRITMEVIYPYRFKFLLAILFMMVSAASVSYRAYLIKPAVDKVFVNKNIVALYMIPIQLIVVAVLCCLSVYMQGLLMNMIRNRISLDLQEDLFKKMLHRELNFFQKQSPARLNAYLGDSAGILDVINIFFDGFILQFFTIISLLGVMLYQNYKLTLVAFIAFPAVGAPIIKLGRKLRSLAERGLEKSMDVSSAVSESFENIQVIKSNNREEGEVKKIHKIFQNVYRISVSIAKKTLITSPMMEMTGTVSLAIVILYSGKSIINGTISAGDFFTFITAMFTAYKPIKSFSDLNNRFQSAVARTKRYYILHDQQNRVRERENPVELARVMGNIKFDGVGFYYPHIDYAKVNPYSDEDDKLAKKYALDGINMNMEAGKSYALVGHSGSGKTTMFNLLMRFYDVTSGAIYMDKVNIKDLSFRCLRNNISIVGQDVKLFNTSIFENIRYTKPDASREEVIEASKMANVDEFASNMEKGYDTIIGHEGALLSGGQKQRISIARALLKNSPILLLDEATSALDPISEDLIQKSLKILMEGKTTIIIAHRLSTIVNCNHIFVLQGGKLCEEGTHEELLALNGIYKDLCDKQFHGGKVKVK